MIRSRRRDFSKNLRSGFILALTFLLLAACSQDTEQVGKDSADVSTQSNEKPAPVSRFLYVWARDQGMQQADFFSVFDVDPVSETYGQLISTLSMGVVANAHHTEYFMPEGDQLFMNGFMTGNSFVVNVADPRAPVMDATFTNAGPYTYPHSFERLPDGHVLSTFQNKAGPFSTDLAVVGSVVAHYS